MPLSKEILDTILSLKKKLDERNEPNGRYSIYDYFNNGDIEFANDESGPHYNRNKECGDYVTEGVVENNNYVGKRKIIWTEKIASTEEHSHAVTEDLPHILMPGQCACLLKDVNLGTYTTPCFVPDRYVTIPDKFIGMVKPATKELPGVIIVVKKLI